MLSCSLDDGGRDAAHACRSSEKRQRTVRAGRAAHPGARRRAVCGSRFRPAVFATATPSRSWARSPASSIRACPAMKSSGSIDAVGQGVPGWRSGQRVGVGWHGGHCGHCPSCRRGDFITCASGQIPGISYDGGYADYMIAPFEALAAIPDELAAAEAAPLLCAGITTYNALRHSGARPGDVVAVLGIGGLGHLGVQFAAKMGCHTVAIARGARQGAAGQEARRARLPRQRRPGRRGRAQQAGRCKGDPLHRHQLQGDELRCSADLASAAR